MWVSVVRGWYRCLHVSPLGCMRSNLEAKVPDPYKRGNLPVEVKPGRIVPQLVNQHGFTSPYDLNKHKTRESYAGLPLTEERLGGRRSECAQRSGFRRRKTTRTSESDEYLHVSLEYVCECGERLV